MKPTARLWIKPVATIAVLAVVYAVAPTTPLDPWNLLNLKKVASMVLALAIIQAFGSATSQYLGERTGALLTGFFGGLISSTATTASLARRSKTSESANSGELLVFLSATSAMLFEGVALVVTGSTHVDLSNILIFIGPIVATFSMILIQYRKHENEGAKSDTFSTFEILPILKLSIFIVIILSVSKVSQIYFGQNGLLVLTSLVSLFEIHGSIIANVQLHEAGMVTSRFLCGLLALSVVSSYLSKLFLVWTLGSASLRLSAVKCTAFLFLSLALSWVVAQAVA